MKKHLAALAAGCVLLAVLANCAPPAAAPAPSPAGFSISGSVAWNGIGLIGAAVTVSRNGWSFSVTTDDDGRFVLPGVPAGEFTLEAAKTGFAFAPLALSVNADCSGQDLAGSAAPGFVIDPWAYAWDGAPRTATNFASASQICALAGGRLPTPTELYRNCHNNPNDAIAGRTLGGTISPAAEAVFQWTNIAHDADNQVIVRLNDGSVSAGGKTGNFQYRCVWPNRDFDTFRGAYVYSVPGESGFRYAVNGGLFHMDTLNRAPLTYNAAVREAAFCHAFIPPESVYTAAIRAGLANDASHRWTWTSDQEGYNGTQFLVGIVRWTGIAPDWSDAHDACASWAYMHSSWLPFRCAGVSGASSPNPKVLPALTDYVDPFSVLKTVNTNEGTANMFTALNACFDNGGHLPTHQEMMMLVQSGLPNDSTGNWLWTSEYETGAYAGLVRWQGVDRTFTGYYSNYSTYTTHPTSLQYTYRTVYHPIDESYAGPPESACHGGRFEVTKDLGNGKAIKIWVDANNRPAKKYQEAVSDCYQSGGQLASRRDLVELLCNGLPNGNDNWVWTSDKASYQQIEVIKLLNDLAGYADQSSDANYSRETVHAASGQASYPYRCVWTNELRIR